MEDMTGLICIISAVGFLLFSIIREVNKSIKELTQVTKMTKGAIQVSRKSVMDYASTYSKTIWEELMNKFKADANYRIGANDVSDLVLNAVYNTCEHFALIPKSEPLGYVEKIDADGVCTKEPILPTDK